MKKEWKKQVEADMEFAEAMLIERGELMPLFVIHCDDGSTVPIGGSWTPTSKEDYYSLISLLCVAYEAVGVVQMAEAWMIKRPIDHPLHGKDYAPPSQASDRIEIVSVTAIWRDKTGRKTANLLREIVRDGEGKAVGLKPAEIEETDGLRGMLADIIPARKPPAGMVREAKQIIKSLEDEGKIANIKRVH